MKVKILTSQFKTPTFTLWLETYWALRRWMQTIGWYLQLRSWQKWFGICVADPEAMDPWCRYWMPLEQKNTRLTISSVLNYENYSIKFKKVPGKIFLYILGNIIINLQLKWLCNFWGESSYSFPSKINLNRYDNALNFAFVSIKILLMQMNYDFKLLSLPITPSDGQSPR